MLGIVLPGSGMYDESRLSPVNSSDPAVVHSTQFVMVSQLKRKCLKQRYRQVLEIQQ